MPEVLYDKPRRSSRIFTRASVVVTGKSLKGRKFREVCHTIVINAHGGLLHLNHQLEDGALIVLMNPATLEEQECRVVYVGGASEDGQRIGVEFLSPAPHFWGMEFAPADWRPSPVPSKPS